MTAAALLQLWPVQLGAVGILGIVLLRVLAVLFDRVRRLEDKVDRLEAELGHERRRAASLRGVLHSLAVLLKELCTCGAYQRVAPLVDEVLADTPIAPEAST